MEKLENGKQQSRDEALDPLIDQVENEHTKDYIRNRVVPQMKWYSKKSAECKRNYQRAMVGTIVLGALIPVVSVIADGEIWTKVVLAALGAGVTAINAYIALHKFEQLWLSYRSTREGLLRILYYYFNNAGVFRSPQTQEERDLLLINTCEDMLSSENNIWKAYQKEQEK